MKSGNFELVNELLKKGAKVNFINESRWTALHAAMQRNDRGISGLLIAHGADLYATNYKEETPLMLAPGKLIQELGMGHIPLSKCEKKK